MTAIQPPPATTTAVAVPAGVALPGLPGDHPGAFLAALGLLALLRRNDHPARLAWTNTWNPVACLHDAPTPDELSALVGACLATLTPTPPTWDARTQPTGLPQTRWREHATATPLQATLQPLTPAAWAATASELGGNKPGRCAPSKLFTLSGNQCPGKIITDLYKCVTRPAEQATLVHEGLFGPARYHRAPKLSLGFDPAGVTDAAGHGKQIPPAVIPVVELLAAYGLTWFPVFDGRTTAFIPDDPTDRDGDAVRGRPRSRFCWPLWSQPLGPASIRTLLTSPDLIAACGAALGSRPARQRLAAWGVHTVAVSERASRGSEKGSYAVFRPATLTPTQFGT